MSCELAFGACQGKAEARDLQPFPKAASAALSGSIRLDDCVYSFRLKDQLCISIVRWAKLSRCQYPRTYLCKAKPTSGFKSTSRVVPSQNVESWLPLGFIRSTILHAAHSLAIEG